MSSIQTSSPFKYFLQRNTPVVARLTQFSGSSPARDLFIPQSASNPSAPQQVFLNYERLTPEDKLNTWQKVASQLENVSDAIVCFDATGQLFVNTSPPPGGVKNPKMTPEKNPLLKALKNPNQPIEYSNPHFVVIKSLSHRPDNQRFLILPKPKSQAENQPCEANYRDLKDFLSPNRANREEKISLLDCMNALLQKSPSTSNLPNLFHANVGRWYEIPYLHMHYTPTQAAESSSSSAAGKK